MQIVINIEKSHFYILMFLIILGGSLVFAYNSEGSGGEPSIMGHSFDEVAPGVYVYGDTDDRSFRIYRPQRP